MAQNDADRAIPVMTLRDVVIFPHALLPLAAGRESSVRAIEKSVAEYDKYIFLVTQKNAEDLNPGAGDLYPVGVVCRILQTGRTPEGGIKVLFEGLFRASWQPVAEENPFGTAPYPCLIPEPLEDINDETAENAEEHKVLFRLFGESLDEYARVCRRLNSDQLNRIRGFDSPGDLADAVMPYLTASFARKQTVLEILGPWERLAAAHQLLCEETGNNELEKKIKARVSEQMERNQHEYYLTEQIKAIHKELGTEDPGAEADELEKKFREKKMPAQALERALEELRKLKQIHPSAAEYAVSRNYIDWLLDLPWNELKDIDIDLNRARDILDGAHFGLEKPKNRILEFLAVQKLTDGLKGPILCLVGPPGVGKTSLARSVAEATGREFVRISLGGVKDEAEIRGHRRTYVGAMPGKIIMAMKRVKSNNPLICLDEIDKLSADYRGDPASALLEVLDPEQNCAFVDHYLDLDYDLSKVFFITTANSLGGIPEPLIDRMEIIDISGYLELEKMQIAGKFLLPRQLKAHGLTADNLRVTDNAVREIIRSYTREAGVRELERMLAALCRKSAVALLEGSPLTQVTVQNLHSMLGVKKYRYDAAESAPMVGVATGLAFNNHGGDILYIETAVMPGTGKILTTGKLGDVMKESAQAAFTYVRSRGPRFGLRADFYKDIDLHIHVPEGAVPKDGPSAGIALATAIASSLLGIPVRCDLAMTGEITLRGRVLAIGGLREKLPAAMRAGIKTVIIPADNKKDLKELPSAVLSALDIRFVSDADEVLPLAFDLPEEKVFSCDAMSMPEKLRADPLSAAGPSPSAVM